VVLGAGDARAKLFLVGEQPGDREDLAGRPFVGPAGAVLDEALEVAGIARETVYLTNAVKHFKHEQRGKRRLHKKPNRYEIEKCRWWLDRELQIIAPRLLVALGRAVARSALVWTGAGSALLLGGAEAAPVARSAG
jgi:uracil-DNA glycosylase